VRHANQTAQGGKRTVTGEPVVGAMVGNEGETVGRPVVGAAVIVGVDVEVNWHKIMLT
jgi:pyrimidine deaminase RibD-like protein